MLGSKSNNGKILDVYGYGVDILSSVYSKNNNNDNYGEYTGTSMATPYVSGSIALIKEAFPDWNKERILEEIKKHNDGFATLDDITRPIVSAYNVITNNLEELKNSSSFEKEEVDFDVNSTSLELNFSTPINLFLPDNIKQINNTENKTFVLNLTNIAKGQNKFELNFSYKMYPSKNFSKTFDNYKKRF